MTFPNYDIDQHWPPDDWAEYYALFHEWDAWYSGDPIRLADVYAARAYTPTPQGMFWAKVEQTERRRVTLHVPIAGDIATTSADLLFSEHPRFRIPEAHQENAPGDAKACQDRLDQFISEGGIYNRLIEAAETCAAMGGVFIKPNWDQELVPYPVLSVAQADNALPEFRWGILTAVTFWKTLYDDGGTAWRLLERHEKGRIYNALYKGGPDNLGVRKPLTELEETASYPDEIATGVNDLLVRYVPNMRPNRRFRGSAIGQSDYSGNEGLMDALDEVFTSWMRDIRLGRGRIIVPNAFLEQQSGEWTFDIDREVFTPVEMDPLSAQGNAITPSQFEIRTTQHRDTALELLDRIISSAGYSPQSFGLKIEGRAESGTALNIRERKSFITRAKKQNYWMSALEDVLYMMLQIDRVQLKNTGYTPYRPSAEFGDSVQNDITQLATSVEMIHRAEAASIETKVRILHPDWDEEMVQAEVQRIKEDNQVQSPIPDYAGA